MEEIKKSLKTWNKKVSPNLSKLLPNAYCCRCRIDGTRDRENFIQFVAIHDVTYTT